MSGRVILMVWPVCSDVGVQPSPLEELGALPLAADQRSLVQRSPLEPPAVPAVDLRSPLEEAEELGALPPY